MNYWKEATKVWLFRAPKETFFFLLFSIKSIFEAILYFAQFIGSIIFWCLPFLVIPLIAKGKADEDKRIKKIKEIREKRRRKFLEKYGDNNG